MFRKNSSSSEPEIRFQIDATEELKKFFLYRKMIDTLMETDPGLNHDMEYIAIDFGSVNYLSSEEKSMILSYMKRYHDHVMESSLDELKAQGYLHSEPIPFLDGILLDFDVSSENADSMTLDAVKYRGGDGAIFLKFCMTYHENQWEEDVHFRGIS